MCVTGARRVQHAKVGPTVEDAHLRDDQLGLRCGGAFPSSSFTGTGFWTP